jgi:hypothetical protein
LRCAINTTFEPPKANELDITARGGALHETPILPILSPGTASH